MIPVGSPSRRRYTLFNPFCMMTITIRGTGIELTPAIREYAEKKVQTLTKFFDTILKADIDVGVRSHHHQKGDIYYAEVNLHVPGQVLRVEKDEISLYKAIDKVKDHLKLELKGLKAKMRQKDKDSIREQKAYSI